MNLSIKLDFQQAARQLNDIARRQVPFAIAKTLNALAFEARNQIVNVTAPRDFNLRNKRFLGVALRVDPASKGRLEARIFDRLGREYLRTQAEGGDKNPRGGMLAIPSKDLQGRRTGMGVPKRLRPRTAPGAFKLQIGAQEYIARRKGRAQRLEILYLLERKAKIPKRFRAYEDAASVIGAKADEVFARELARALATARR